MEKSPAQACGSVVYGLCAFKQHGKLVLCGMHAFSEYGANLLLGDLRSR